MISIYYHKKDLSDLFKIISFLKHEQMDCAIYIEDPILEYDGSEE